MYMYVYVCTRLLEHHGITRLDLDWPDCGQTPLRDTMVPWYHDIIMASPGWELTGQTPVSGTMVP